MSWLEFATIDGGYHVYMAAWETAVDKYCDCPLIMTCSLKMTPLFSKKTFVDKTFDSCPGTVKFVKVLPMIDFRYTVIQ